MNAVQTIRALFVSWQAPDSRRYFPVGRLAIDLLPEQADYEFVYIRGTFEAMKVGFRPFLGFPDVQGVYRDDRLFPFFTNRLMPRNRPDFDGFLARLGLNSADADDMGILARSGGVRATDSLEMFPLPVRDPQTGCFETRFWMHGFRHLAADQQARVLELRPGDVLTAVREPFNPTDPNAIQLFAPGRVFVGYVPRYLAGDACHLLSQCDSFEVVVNRVNPPPAPTQQRLLCDVHSCWPDGFVPCNSDVYQPIAEQALQLELHGA